ncbi:MAG TPA: lipase family protein [Acidimicrobiia bacterium]|nr:lipase family protein [Acidimicrobiia bacterium]
MLTLAMVIATVAAACGGGGGSDDAASDDAPQAPLTFYRPDTVLSSGTPGDILSKEPIELMPSMHGTGWKVTYVSTTPAGDLVPVSGVLVQPLTPAPPGGYPVVVWTHGTTGLGDQCAPSNTVPFGIAGADALLDAGDVIAAPDYEGLGPPGEIHPYLVGVAEGNNALDAARAARAIGGGNVTVTWGWSQGGHASLFARALQPTYAPELDYRGAAAQAPVTDAGMFLIQGRHDVNVFPNTAEAILSWSEVYHETDLTDLVVVADAEKARLAQQACTEDIVDNTTKPLDEIFRSDPQNSETWIEAAKTNSVKVGATSAPVLLTHGDADVLVPIAGTVAFFDALCAHHVPTVLLRDPAWDHTLAWFDTLDEIDAWITDRIAGNPAPSSCP